MVFVCYFVQLRIACSPTLTSRGCWRAPTSTGCASTASTGISTVWVEWGEIWERIAGHGENIGWDDAPAALPRRRIHFPTSHRRQSTAFRRSMLTMWFDIVCLEDPSECKDLQVKGMSESARDLLDLLRQEDRGEQDRLREHCSRCIEPRVRHVTFGAALTGPLYRGVYRDEWLPPFPGRPR